MLEERLFLILSYLLIVSLLMLFCFFTSFTRKVKLTGILVVALFYFISWNSYINILGWPSTQELPDKFRISWVVIQEPGKADKKEGGLYLWVRNLNEMNIPYGMPRSYELIWNDENHKVAQSALHKLEEGEKLNGTKTYGVVDKDNEGNKANQYNAQEGELQEGRPSFEFVEVSAPELPAKKNI
tara:strand:- start:993 stop:1544 length:552 start_codon:yes stop_codon:yes gene_type:complete